MNGGIVLVIGGAEYVSSHPFKALARAGYLPVSYGNLICGHEWSTKWELLGRGYILDTPRLAGVIARKPSAVFHSPLSPLSASPSTLPQDISQQLDYTVGRTCIRDYVHVGDGAEAHVLANQRLGKGELHQHSMRERERGISVAKLVDAVRAVAGFAFGIVNGLRLIGDPYVLLAVAVPGRAALGWAPCHASIAEIIETAWRWSACQLRRSAPPCAEVS